MNISGVSVYRFNIDNDAWVACDVASEKTIKFLTGIYLSKDFQKRIKVFREYFDLSDKGLSDHENSLVGEIFSEYFMQKESSVISYLFEYLGFQSMSFYGFNLYLLCKYDAYLDIPPTSQIDIYKNANVQMNEIEELIEGGGTVLPTHSPKNTTIVISRKMSITKLKRLIDKNSKEIKESLDSLPEEYDQDGTQEIELSHEIFQLYEQGKTPTEISNFMMEKYPKHKHAYDQGWVANRIFRYKKRQSEFENIKPGKQDHATSDITKKIDSLLQKYQ